MSDTIDRMHHVFSEALQLASNKNADYGDAWKLQGWRGNLSRIFEKDQRLRTLLWRGEAVPPHVRENVRETAIDMMNTLAFFVMNHDAGVEWGHEMPFPPALPQPSPGTVVYGHDYGYGMQPEPSDAAVTTTMQTVREGIESAVANGENPFDETAVVEDVAAEGKKPSPVRRQPQRNA